MKILITGGAGFIGYHLSKKFLSEDNKITIVDNLERGKIDNDLKNLLKHPNLDLYKADLSDASSLKDLNFDFDIIIHLAAILGVENVLKNSFKVLDINKKLLSTLIDFSKSQLNLKRLIFTSTSEIYAGTLKKYDLKIPTPEESNIVVPDLNQPRTSYMLSKVYGEAMCFASGIPTTILRPHNIFGPRMGMSHVIPQIFKRAFNTPYKGDLGIYSPSHTRSFCFIEDAVRLINKLISLEEKENILVNLGTQGPEISMFDLASALIKIMGREDIKLLKLEDTAGSPLRRAPDVTRLNKLTGISDRTELSEGLKKTFDWYYSKSNYLTSK